MKEFIKGRWFPFTIAIAIEVILFIFLYCNNFRITYAPDLENSWDAISTFAAWAGVVLSFVAIMVAIQIPKKIADRQDKIALFEKRMDCYGMVQNICAFARQISDLNNKKGIQTAIKLYFGEASLFTENQNIAWYTITLKHQEVIIVKGLFLFREYDTEILQELLMSIIELSWLVSVRAKEEVEEPISDAARIHKEKICNICSKLEKTLIPQMEEELQLYTR